MKKEKGSVTLYVTLSCIILVTVLSLTVFNITNRNNNQKKQLEKITDNYSVSEEDMEQAYLEAGGDNTKYVTLEEVEALMEENKQKLKDEVKKEVKLEAFPIGSIFISTTATNPSSYIGGTWTSYGEGRTLIGAGTCTDSNSTSKTFSANETGGEYSHKLIVNEMPSHSHGYYMDVYKDKGNQLGVQIDTSVDPAKSSVPGWGPIISNKFVVGQRSGTFIITATGGNGFHNNIQPYIVTYIWKRTG